MAAQNHHNHQVKSLLWKWPLGWKIGPPSTRHTQSLWNQVNIYGKWLTIISVSQWRGVSLRKLIFFVHFKKLFGWKGLFQNKINCELNCQPFEMSAMVFWWWAVFVRLATIWQPHNTTFNILIIDQNQILHWQTFVYIFIHIYVCVCVCVYLYHNYQQIYDQQYRVFMITLLIRYLSLKSRAKLITVRE